MKMNTSDIARQLADKYVVIWRGEECRCFRFFGSVNQALDYSAALTAEGTISHVEPTESYAMNSAISYVFSRLVRKVSEGCKVTRRLVESIVREYESEVVLPCFELKRSQTSECVRLVMENKRAITSLGRVFRS